MTGIVGGCTVVTLQLSRNVATGMLPELVLVAPLVHLADSVSVSGEVGLVVTVSVNVRVCAGVSCVPTGTTPGRLDAVIDSVRGSLLTTVQVTAQPPPVLQATVPVIVLWCALAAPAMPTTAKPTARTSVTSLETPRWIGAATIALSGRSPSGPVPSLT